MKHTTTPTNQTAAGTKKAKVVPVHLQDADQIKVTIQKWNLDRKRRAVEQFMLWTLLPGGTLKSSLEEGKYYHSEDVLHVPSVGIAVHIGCDCDDQRGHIERLERRAKQLGLETEEPVHCKHYYIRLLLEGRTLSYCGATIRVHDELVAK